MQKKTVILLGKGILAIKIASWFLKSHDYQLLCVVPQIPEPPWGKSIVKWAQTHDVDIVQSGDFHDLITDKKSVVSDLVVSVFYDRIISEDFIKKVKKIINVHNSPLPKYRGVKPIHWSLKNNEKIHGVTIHDITVGVDDGPIYSQVTFSIYPEFDEVIDVYKRSLVYAWLLFLQTIPYIWSIRPKKQNHSLSSYYSRRDDKKLGERLTISRKRETKS